MNIFWRRPLGLFLCIILGSFSLFSTSNRTLFIILFSLSLILLILSLFNISLIRDNRLTIRLILFSIVICAFLSSVYFNNFFPRQYYSERSTVTALVTNKSQSSDKYTTYTLKTEYVNEENVSYKLLWSSYENRDYNIGDMLYFTAKIDSIEKTESSDGETYYVGQGYSARVVNVKDLTVLSKDNYVFTKYFSDLRNSITNKLIDITNPEAGGLLSALIIGERQALDATLNINFYRIGITHILALSGSHFTILAGALSAILSLMKLNKKTKYCFVILFSVAYMLLTGMPSTVVRSGIMVILVHLLFLLMQTKDTFTTLTIAIFLIILFSPYAIYDLSLWLSAFATFGVVGAIEYKNETEDKSESKFKSILMSLKFLVISSMFAIGATLVFSLTTFSTLSSLALIATIIFSPILELLVYVGLILLIFGNVTFIVDFTKYYVSLVKIISEWLANVKWSLFSTDHLIIEILSYTFIVLFFAFFVLKIRRKRLYISLISILFTAIFIIGSALSYAPYKADTSLYISGGENTEADLFVSCDGNESTLIYVGDHTSDCASFALSSSTQLGYSYVDKVILTEYDYNTPSFVKSFCRDLKYKFLYLPKPVNNTELSISYEIAEILSLNGAEIKFYGLEESIIFGNRIFTLNYRTSLYNDNKRVETVFTIKDGDYTTLYLSNGVTEHSFMRVEEKLSSADILIIGNAGVPYSNNYIFDLRLNVRLLIFGAKVNYTEDYVDFYKEKGASVIIVPEAPISIKR